MIKTTTFLKKKFRHLGDLRFFEHIPQDVERMYNVSLFSDVHCRAVNSPDLKNLILTRLQNDQIEIPNASEN